MTLVEATWLAVLHMHMHTPCTHHAYTYTHSYTQQLCAILLGGGGGGLIKESPLGMCMYEIKPCVCVVVYTIVMVNTYLRREKERERGSERLISEICQGDIILTQ